MSLYVSCRVHAARLLLISVGDNADHDRHHPGRHDDDDGHGMAPAEMTMTIMAVKCGDNHHEAGADDGLDLVQ